MVQLSPFETEALLLSLKVAAAAVSCSLPFAIALAWLLARKEFPGKSVVNALVHLPLVVPPVVIGYLLLVTLGRRGVIGSWLDETLGIVIAFTWVAAAVASAVMAFPLMVRAIRLSIEAVDTRLESVARTLGASWLRVLLTITLPLTLPGIVAGAALAFARCLGEFGATITFASNIPGITQTLPLALYTAINTPGGEDGAMRLVVISIVLAFVALGISELMARRVTKLVTGV
ncbi:molybdate ABC transporter permease subunit [Iodidimonas sp. SYSU 1G8]|uniref:molybdate ABC transporter permease subunit n=1 Tax=Iodidimonas sp. SYSU 1G8 TaxID=3133967 RepID=UPI0031FEC28C